MDERQENGKRGASAYGGTGRGGPEQEALLALSREEVERLLEDDDPALLELLSAFIRDYSARAGEALKQGKDYLELLSPAPGLPAAEALAMLMVLEALEEELDGEE